MRVELPESFEKRMKEMLGDEYEAYIESYDNPRPVSYTHLTLPTN